MAGAGGVEDGEGGGGEVGDGEGVVVFGGGGRGVGFYSHGRWGRVLLILVGGRRWLLVGVGEVLKYTYEHRVSSGCLPEVDVVVFGVWVLWGRWRGSATVLNVAVTVVESLSSRPRAALWVLSTPLSSEKGCDSDEKLC